MPAERRAKAFTAGTVKGAASIGHGDDAARFYAAQYAGARQLSFPTAVDLAAAKQGELSLTLVLG